MNSGEAPEDDYIGKDLKAMEAAVNYRRWILSHFRPHLGTRILEVGAGVGSYTEQLQAEASAILALEPSPRQFSLLSKRIQGHSHIHCRCSLLADAAAEVRAFSPTSALLINVLEHVEKDRDLISEIHGVLAPDGHLCIFVPALPWLMGEFDRSVGHVRRYYKAELRDLLESGGFRVEKIRYMDFLGVIPWIVKFRLLGSDDLRYQDVWLYDRLVIPWLSRVEDIWPPPLGKNLLVVAKRV